MDGVIDVVGSGYDATADDYKSVKINFSTDYLMSYTYNNTTELFKVNSGSYINTTVDAFGDNGYGWYVPTKYTMDATFIADYGDVKIGIKDASYNYTYNTSDYNTSFYITKGTFFADNMSMYVDYDTSYDMSTTPFVMSDYYGEFQEGGEAHFNMANSGKMKIVIDANANAISYVDADGDGTFETVEAL